MIDIHGHTFNARYLPIRNILLGKRDFSPLAIFLYDGWAKRIAAAITGATRLSPVGDSDDPKHELSFDALCDRTVAGSADDLEAALRNECVITLKGAREIFDAADKEIGARTNTKEAREARLDLIELQLDERLHGGPLKDVKKALGRFGFLVKAPIVKDFLVSLIAPDRDIPGLFHRSFENRVQLMVSHMMDLAPVYAQPEDGAVLLPFSEQIERTALFQADADANMVYFVAYNPFRDNGGHGGRALRIVKDAVENRGAYGIKVYPPSGYRPTENEIPAMPRALFTDEPDRQWKARYEGVTGRILDQRMQALFEYCSENRVPLFAHCLDGEFEARKGYAACFADPRWWRPVLAKYPDLILCFGHAGSDRFWFGENGGREDWGRLVYELCVMYENVYCGFGVHAEILDPKKRRHFVELMSSLIEAPRGKYPIEDKILYGSDWYMPRDSQPMVDYLRGYQTAFTDERLIPFYRRFFFENALEFLDVENRLQRQNSLPRAVRDDLGKLLAQRTPR